MRLHEILEDHGHLANLKSLALENTFKSSSPHPLLFFPFCLQVGGSLVHCGLSCLQCHPENTPNLRHHRSYQVTAMLCVSARGPSMNDSPINKAARF